MEEKKKSSDKGSVAAGAGTAIGGGLLLVTNLKKGKKVSKGQLKKTGKNFYLILNNLKGKKASRKANLNTVNRSAGGDWYHSRAYSELENTDNISMENYYDEQERLFSTGDEELDDILEEVYYSGIEDGYDYAYEEREYAEDSDSDNKGKGAGTAVAGLGAGSLAVGGYRAKRAQAKAEKEGAERVRKAVAEGKAAKMAVDNAYMEGRTKTSGVISSLLNEIKRKRGEKAANKFAQGLEAEAKLDAGKMMKKGDKKAAQILKRHGIAGGALLAAGGLAVAASGLKKGDKKENNQQKNYSDMEIRRKVFSLLEDENGEERYYSTTEFEMDYDWETGEKYFSEKDDKGMSTAAKIGIGAGAALGTAGLAYGGGKLMNKAMQKRYDKLANDAAAIEKLDKSFLGKANKKVAKATGWVDKKAGQAWGGVKNAAGAVGRGGKAAWEWTKDKSGKYIKAPAKQVWKWAKAHPKAAAGIGLGTAAVATGAGIGIHALKKKKSNKDSNK